MNDMQLVDWNEGQVRCDSWIYFNINNNQKRNWDRDWVRVENCVKAEKVLWLLLSPGKAWGTGAAPSVLSSPSVYTKYSETPGSNDDDDPADHKTLLHPSIVSIIQSEVRLNHNYEFIIITSTLTTTNRKDAFLPFSLTKEFFGCHCVL